ncbi:hypothetical protein ALQ79_05636 [Pseudomonas amygdali pv. lachrymans]|nr:hypothetical protein ALQ79_05636 [Pseudomonas amygdali pv. lachrymans]
MQLDLALGSKQLGSGVLREQADALRDAGQQGFAAGDADVFAGAQGQVLAAVQVGAFRRGGGDVGRGGGDQQWLLVTRCLASSAAADRPGGIAAVALLFTGPLARGAVVAAVSHVGIAVELGEAVQAFLHGQGVVLLRGVGQGLDALLTVFQLLLRFAGIDLCALCAAAFPGAEVQTLLGAQSTVSIGAQFKPGTAQASAIVAALVDQVTKVKLGMPVAAVDLGADLAGRVVHHPLVETTAADFLAFVACHQTAGVPGGFVTAVDLAHDQWPINVVIQEGDNHLFAGTRHMHTAPVRSAARLHHAQPAGTQLAILRQAVPVKAYANPVQGVGKHFMAAGRDDHGGLRARIIRLEMLGRAAERHAVQLAFKAIEEETVAAHAQ